MRSLAICFSYNQCALMFMAPEYTNDSINDSLYTCFGQWSLVTSLIQVSKVLSLSSLFYKPGMGPCTPHFSLCHLAPLQALPMDTWERLRSWRWERPHFLFASCSFSITASSPQKQQILPTAAAESDLWLFYINHDTASFFPLKGTGTLGWHLIFRRLVPFELRDSHSSWPEPTQRSEFQSCRTLSPSP